MVTPKRRRSAPKSCVGRTGTGQGLDNGFSLNEEVESFAYSYELGVEVLLEDQPCSNQSRGAFTRLLRAVECTRDLLGFIAFCSELRDELVRTGSWDRASSKRYKGRWVRGVISAISYAVPPNLIVHPSSQFNRVVTFLGWLKRLPVCIAPTEESVARYLACEERIRAVQLDTCEYVPMIRSIWFEWLGEFRLTQPFLPKHGSGSTADAGRVRARKWHKLGTDHAVRICLKDESLEQLVELPPKQFERTAKVAFVPKQAGKDRTICMEPATLMYLQQGVLRQLQAYMRRQPMLSKYTNLNDQTVNQTLCASAYTRRLSTIDLSDASDSVSWRLIGMLTKGMPIYRYLLGTKSTHASVMERKIELVKFAPMGSALCFPIETILFASIVECAYRLHFGKASEGQFSGCSAYGDDIICPEEIYHLVVDILTSLGFIVNESKSSSSGPYYESCGVEYLYGVKIETIRHPRAHLISHQVCSPEQVGLVTNLANTLLSFHSYTARRLFLKHQEGVLVQVGWKRYPLLSLVHFGDTGIIPVVPQYTTTQWHAHYQRAGQWGLNIVSGNESSAYDYEEYNQKLKERLARPEPSHVIHERFSDKGAISLLLLGHTELLETGDIEDVGSCRAGRLTCKVKRLFR